MKKVRIYEYSKCSTCRNALKYLDGRRIPYERTPIIETPPPEAELKRMLKAQGGNIKKLFNTSGEMYRELKISEKLPSMSVDEAIELLASNGKLIKRPFVLMGEVGLLGFKQDEWDKAL